MKKAILFCLILTLLASFAYAAVDDDDEDGVSNENDICPNSQTNIVDQLGCSCAQKTESNCNSLYPGALCCVPDNDPCTENCGIINGVSACNAPIACPLGNYNQPQQCTGCAYGNACYPLWTAKCVNGRNFLCAAQNQIIDIGSCTQPTSNPNNYGIDGNAPSCEYYEVCLDKLYKYAQEAIDCCDSNILNNAECDFAKANSNNDPIKCKALYIIKSAPNIISNVIGNVGSICPQANRAANCAYYKVCYDKLYNYVQEALDCCENNKLNNPECDFAKANSNNNAQTCSVLYLIIKSPIIVPNVIGNAGNCTQQPGCQGCVYQNICYPVGTERCVNGRNFVCTSQNQIEDTGSCAHGTQGCQGCVYQNICYPVGTERCVNGRNFLCAAQNQIEDIGSCAQITGSGNNIKRPCANTNAIYYPSDTVCMDKWPNTNGVVSMSVKFTDFDDNINYYGNVDSCIYYEVCSDELDKYVQEAVDCCESNNKNDVECQYAKGNSGNNPKKCKALYLIKSAELGKYNPTSNTAGPCCASGTYPEWQWWCDSITSSQNLYYGRCDPPPMQGYPPSPMASIISQMPCTPDPKFSSPNIASNSCASTLFPPTSLSVENMKFRGCTVDSGIL